MRVTGEPVGNGYAVEVEDRGLGMGKDALAEANHRITRTETLDLFDSDRLGLFVVSRLAARQDIKVHLKTSPYGGTTAVVLLPTALLHGEAAATPPGAAHEMARPEEHLYARVPGSAGQQEPVTAPAGRPALASAASAATRTTTSGRPTGAPALRLHRSSDDPDASRAHTESDGDCPPEPPSGESDDLPRRVRQASLAPQLREAGPAGRAGPSRPGRARGDEERTPEAVRDRMAAYRDGWSRGGGRRPGRPAPPEPLTGDRTEGDPA
ncbi:hypothetical protein RKD37_007506 [Streptomyces ambofaciens]